MEIDNLKVKTYIEDEYKLAYAKARKELGHNLVIIEKKEVKEGGMFGLFGKKKVRVTFGVELVKKSKELKNEDESNNELLKALRDVAVKHMEEDKKENTFKPLSHELFTIKDEEDLQLYSPFKKEQKKSFEDIQKELKISIKTENKVEETINLDDSIFEENEIDKLKRELKKELENNKIKEEPIDKNNDFIDFLRDRDIEKKLAIEIDSYFDKNGYSRVNYSEGLEAFIRENIKVRKLEDTKKIMMLIGPTGVGKTTTCAKIVANNWRNEKKVGFITADTYRLEAVSQLKAYANIMRVPIEVVNKPEDLTKTIEKFKDKDLVLMDTAGRSPKNKEQMDELKKYIESKGENLETTLVLSATSKLSVLNETIEKFEKIGFDSIIITKIDETSNLNSLLSIMKKYKYPFYYMTNGQSVPDDIEMCTEDLLTEIFMKGIK